MHACETTTPRPFFRAKRGLTVPAPYPPYALAMISPFTLLPFATAAMLWYALMTLCCALAIVLLARVTKLPILVTWAALALSLGLESLPTGQVVPLCLVALLAAASFAQSAEWDFAAVAVAIAMIEPHVAFPAAIALYIRYPATRTVIVLLGILFIAGSLAFSGIERNVEYVGAVLRAHALSEVSRDNQYSLSTVLAALGVSDERAVFFGNLSYLIMLVLGTIVGLRLSDRFRDAAFTLLVPPAFVVLGGPYIHSVEIVAALPFCLLLYNYTKAYRSAHMALLVAIVLLAVPWIDATSAALFNAPLFPAAFLVYTLHGGRTSTLATAVATGCAILLLFILAGRPGPPAHQFVASAHPYLDPNLADASWRAVALANSTNRFVMWLLRLPTWIGLIGLVVIGCLFTRKTALEEAVHA
jgi:Glycosyltransferase family 87